jgi:hypothetical protein
MRRLSLSSCAAKRWLALALLLSQAAHASVTPAELGCKTGEARGPFRKKPDFAALEADPGTRIPEKALARLMPDDFTKGGLDQECVDRIYASLPSGQMPELGIEYESVAFSPDGGGFQALAELLLPQKGAKAALSRMIASNLSALPNALVRGMVFSQTQGGEHPEYEAKSRLDRAALLILAPAQALHLGKELFFPAHVYCGQSLLDSRRESIVIDPAYPEDFSDFKAGVDEIPSHAGMNLREEIRMIRPGLYLGRIYGARVYLMSFLLYNSKADLDGHLRDNECWLGTQARTGR